MFVSYLQPPIAVKAVVREFALNYLIFKNAVTYCAKKQTLAAEMGNGRREKGRSRNLKMKMNKRKRYGNFMLLDHIFARVRFKVSFKRL